MKVFASQRYFSEHILLPRVVFRMTRPVLITIKFVLFLHVMIFSLRGRLRKIQYQIWTTLERVLKHPPCGQFNLCFRVISPCSVMYEVLLWNFGRIWHYGHIWNFGCILHFGHIWHFGWRRTNFRLNATANSLLLLLIDNSVWWLNCSSLGGLNCSSY